MTRFLLDGGELPDTLTVQVGGLLDKRVSMVEYEVMDYEDPSMSRRKIDPGDIENLRVFGLLFPSDSELLERESLLRDHAHALRRAIGKTYAYEMASLEIYAKVLDSGYFSPGTFDVRVIEHHAGLAGTVKSDEMTPGVEVPVTVAMVN